MTNEELDEILTSLNANMETASVMRHLRAENERLLNANLSLRNKYLRLQHKLGRIAKVLDEPTAAAAAIRESGE